MEDNNVVVAENKQPESSKPGKGAAFGAAVKEFFRKQMINLKRKPNNIAFLLIIVTTAFNLLTLGTYSEAIIGSAAYTSLDWVGLMVFANTLFSLLTVVAFMNSFPKIKKPNSKTTVTVKFTKASKININLVMGAVFLVFCIIMIVCECVFYNLMSDFYVTYTGDEMTENMIYYANLISKSMTYSIVHIVLVAVDIVLALLTPVTGKLLAKIDTNKEIESAVSNMQEIDLASED